MFWTSFKSVLDTNYSDKKWYALSINAAGLELIEILLPTGAVVHCDWWFKLIALSL